MSDFGTIVLIIGVVLTGLMAGVYFAFTTAVVPGVARTDDRTYVTVTQRINETILNGWFLTAFMGSLAVPVVAAFLHLDADDRPRLPWIVAGAVLYGVTVVITFVLNIPLNNQIAAAGDVDDRSAPAVRQAYHQRWLRYNNARTVLGLAAVITLAVALSRPMG